MNPTNGSRNRKTGVQREYKLFVLPLLFTYKTRHLIAPREYGSTKAPCTHIYFASSWFYYLLIFCSIIYIEFVLPYSRFFLSGLLLITYEWEEGKNATPIYSHPPISGLRHAAPRAGYLHYQTGNGITLVRHACAN